MATPPPHKKKFTLLNIAIRHSECGRKDRHFRRFQEILVRPAGTISGGGVRRPPRKLRARWGSVSAKIKIGSAKNEIGTAKIKIGSANETTERKKA